MKNFKRFILFAILPALFLASCRKEWLEEKPLKSLVVPTTIGDYQAMLDNDIGDNGGAAMNANQVIMDELGAGDFYVTDQSWDAQSPLERNIYIWASEMYGGENGSGVWGTPYQRIFYTNVILEGIDKITASTPSEQTAWNQVKGSAYFLRAYTHYNIASLYCKPYIKSSANLDLGIPLRLNSDFSEPSVRATVQNTYDQIISDLKEARSLLPIVQPDNQLSKLRPTKAAADAMLARVYLSMSDYDNALNYANSCLQVYNTLLDYNDISVSASASVVFTPFNPEIIFFMQGMSVGLFRSSVSIVDSTLYRSYASDDLRRSLFFRFVNNNTVLRFRGTYVGNASFQFTGLATDEIYLIRAESYARKGMISEAMESLNSLMQNRWKSSTWVPFTATDQNDAIAKILNERWRELLFRGIRWTDLRRLNLEPAYAKTLTKMVHGQIYTLPPNDQKYVLQIPPEVIAMTGMPQNPR